MNPNHDNHNPAGKRTLQAIIAICIIAFAVCLFSYLTSEQKFVILRAEKIAGDWRGGSASATKALKDIETKRLLLIIGMVVSGVGSITCIYVKGAYRKKAVSAPPIEEDVPSTRTKLIELDGLFKEGLITQEEHDEKRHDLIQKI